MGGGGRGVVVGGGDVGCFKKNRKLSQFFFRSANLNIRALPKHLKNGGKFLEKNGQKCRFWALFRKLLHIGRPWMNGFGRVLQKVESLFTKSNQFS